MFGENDTLTHEPGLQDVVTGAFDGGEREAMTVGAEVGYGRQRSAAASAGSRLGPVICWNQLHVELRVGQRRSILRVIDDVGDCVDRLPGINVPVPRFDGEQN